MKRRDRVRDGRIASAPTTAIPSGLREVWPDARIEGSPMSGAEECPSWGTDSNIERPTKGGHDCP
jgi:hypothetical protein